MNLNWLNTELIIGGKSISIEDLEKQKINETLNIKETKEDIKIEHYVNGIKIEIELDTFNFLKESGLFFYDIDNEKFIIDTRNLHPYTLDLLDVE